MFVEMRAPSPSGSKIVRGPGDKKLVTGFIAGFTT
jgi:hypothetical protein